MLLTLQPETTVEAFDQFVLLPENADRLFEYINGEIVEVPSNPCASYISGRFLRHIGAFADEHKLGYTTGEAGGYMVSGERYAPDVAFIAKAKQPQLAREGYNPNPPDLVVEFDFPSTYESQVNLRTKVINYLAAGTVVWLALPDERVVEVYTPGQPVQRFGVNGVLDGGSVLPGFKLAVKDIFPDEQEAQS